MQASHVRSDEDEYKYDKDQQANDEYTTNDEHTNTVAENTTSSLPDDDKKEDDVENVTMLTPPKTEPEENSEDNAMLENMKPGERLRYLREQKNLSIEHVADRLYLDSGVITALEEDDYSRLPSAIFIRGYLRNYAKLLEISPEPLLDAYDHVDDGELPLIAPQTKSKQQASSGDWWVKGIGFILFIALMVLMAQSGINYFNTQPPAEDEHIGIDIEEELNNMAENAELSNENGEATIYTPPNEEENGTTTTEGQDATGSTTEETTSSTEATTEENTATEANNATTAENQAALRKLTLHYLEASWTRVTDKTGDSVYEGTPQGGKVINIEGEPPFKVRLGVLEHVNIEYNGEKVSAAQHPERSGRNVTVGKALPSENN